MLLDFCLQQSHLVTFGVDLLQPKKIYVTGLQHVWKTLSYTLFFFFGNARHELGTDEALVTLDIG